MGGRTKVLICACERGGGGTAAQVGGIIKTAGNIQRAIRVPVINV